MSISIHDKAFAEQKLVSAIELVDRIIVGDWAYLDSRAALIAIREQYQKTLTGLRNVEPDADDAIVSSWCSDARSIVARYHTFIGVILRSSNVRNAFEVFAPIKRIAEQLLGAGSQIILGSEWSYSPFVYPIPMRGLENFVFIGSPASEADNSLLVPLAGHELGHAVWRRPNVNNSIRDKVRAEVLRVFLNQPKNQPELFSFEVTTEDLESDFRFRSLWKKPYELAVRQCEEIFCDVLGCWIFGDAFLHAFRYMTCPEVGNRSAEYYPTNRIRAEILDRASHSFAAHDTNLKSFFQTAKSAAPEDVRTADEVAVKVSELIIAEVDQFCSSTRLVKPSEPGIEAALASLRLIRPAERLSTIADVVNAGWMLRFDINGWDVPGLDDDRKLRVIDDLVLKSFEVNEWQHVGGGGV